MDGSVQAGVRGNVRMCLEGHCLERVVRRDILQDLPLGQRLARLRVAEQPDSAALIVLIVSDRHVVRASAQNAIGTARSHP